MAAAATANGYANGYTNGNKPRQHTNGSLQGANGHAAVSRKNSPAPQRRGFFARLSSIVARLLTWYSLFTVLFRCPPTLDACDDSSPQVCKTYFRVKEAVTPHVTPYYDSYAAPYVNIARPYYDTLDRVVITPSRTYAVKYGGPRVAQAQAYGQVQWEKSVQPQITRYQLLAKDRYDQSVSPHVEKVSTAVGPYYDIARTNALQTYHEMILPAYVFLQPYASHGYDVAYAFTTNTAIPTTSWAWNRTYTFLDSAVWPHVRDVYTVKVEPQLVRIGERLGRYNDKKPKSTTGDVDHVVPKSAFTKPASSVSSSTTSAAQSTVEAESTPSSAPAEKAQASESAEIKVNADKAPKNREEIRALAAKNVAEDLELWEGKFTQAAEDSATEIEERVDEISARMIHRHANTMGKSLVRQLEDTVAGELEGIKKTIVNILKKNKDQPEQRDEELVAAVRETGLKIKNKAQDVRDWRQSYLQETEIAVTQAAKEHFAILDNTGDLALQKIGMKWAWMDGVTYKDWQKYHKLKAQFAEWTEDLKRLIMTHPGLLAADTAGSEIEDEAMGVAAAAAEELARLKQAVAWKIAAGDFTDDFESEDLRLAAESAEKAAAEADTEASTIADGEEAGPVTVSLSEAQAEDFDTSAVPPLESLTDEPTESATDLKSDVTTSSRAPSEDEATSAADATESLATDKPVDGPDQMEETIVDSPDDPRPPVEEATATVKSAMFGAAAQSVPSRQPILDDDFSSSGSSILSVVQSDVPASITSAAQAAYTSAIAGAADHYSRAMAAVSAQISGEPKPVHEEMMSSVSSAYFGAMASANSRLGDALTAASEGIYGTPTTSWLPNMPTIPSVDWEKAQSIAQQNLQDSVNWASEQYEAAKVAIGAAEPTPSTYLEGAEKRAEKLLDQAKHNYFAGVGIAHARYSEFLEAASGAVSSLTATPTPTNVQESASSVVSVASESAAAAAESLEEMASDATNAVAENWDILISRASSQIYGAPTPNPWYQNFYDSAGDYASSAGDLAASATDAAVDQVSAASSLAGEYGASATDAASSQYAVISSIVSELIVGKEPPFTESVYSRLAHAWTMGASSASSLVNAASETVASAASEVTDAAGSAGEKVKETMEHFKDEL
ncbi:hypothetical protein F5Y15DRAFT_419567 [Xylariaceae sp. FL0016]|nr:hypothetical protein F5Y15DRAFT_419567 [Xylariaceae sp. FL0016]